jgi:ketosteroid isomerase-like protein
MKAQIQEQKKGNEQLVSSLPKVIADLVKAQNNFDSAAYADCFAETAIVFDEGKTHKGRTEIENWIDNANKSYKAVMKPTEYSANKQVLKAEISGNFPGSPLVLNYQFEIKEEEIYSLKIV